LPIAFDITCKPSKKTLKRSILLPKQIEACQFRKNKKTHPFAGDTTINADAAKNLFRISHVETK